MQPEETTSYWFSRFITRGYPPHAAMVYAEQEARRYQRRVQLEQDEEMQAKRRDKKTPPPNIEFRLQ